MMQKLEIPYGTVVNAPDQTRYGDRNAMIMQQQENSLMRKEGEAQGNPNVSGSGAQTTEINRYEGERDEQGRRSGNGKFFFADGSTYSGQW